MQQVQVVYYDRIRSLFQSFSSENIENITPLPLNGSNRLYFRIYTPQKSYIATFSTYIAENRTFIAFSTTLQLLQLPVPQILAVEDSGELYIQEDLGAQNLLDVLTEKGATPQVKNLYKKAVTVLAELQVKAHEKIDYNLCINSRSFSKEAILHDLFYFKFYFLDIQSIHYDKEQLMQEFEQLACQLQQSALQGFMYRDFQSRNIIVRGDNVYFIDYQGGMQGPVQYDLASLLWQAKAQLSKEWKDEIAQHYYTSITALLKKTIDKNLFFKQYKGFVLIRLLQVLGAYGFRGLFEKKAHFISSIPLALKNIQQFIVEEGINQQFTTLTHILHSISTNEMIEKYTEKNQMTNNTSLIVEVNSFSYRKGLPTDATENGGGYIFDCRAILNPGRIDIYKTKSGQDAEVQQFLLEKTAMPQFLQHIFSLIDISIQDYLQRGFTHLQVNFGCTGGQHRSVYAAEKTAFYIKEKYGIVVQLTHTNKENWVKTI